MRVSLPCNATDESPHTYFLMQDMLPVVKFIPCTIAMEWHRVNQELHAEWMMLLRHWIMHHICNKWRTLIGYFSHVC